MRQVTAKRTYWWRALDAQTSGPGIAFRERYLPYPEATALELGDHRRKASPPSKAKPSLKTLQIPRGERGLRITRRRKSRWNPALVAAVSICLVSGAAAVALPLDRIKTFYRSSDFRARANDVIIASGFGIDQVNISGQRYTLDTDVFDAIDLPNVRTFADFDSGAVLKRIERLPWVDTAQMTRVYPATLDIVIKERTPAVIWTRDNQNYLVDATGRLLGPAPAATSWALPRVAGEGADREAAALLAALRSYPSIESQYSYGERIGERRWRVFLKNGTALDLGADREVEGLEQIVSAPAATAALKGVPMVIDVRAPGRMALRPAANAFKTASNAQALP